ncbi:MAG: uridylate kinase [Synergistaceae bacterium]|nr:uridylate kinase [Synergistaceae bacterium]
MVKIGGAEGNRLEPLMEEIAGRASRGERWIVVHGASGVMDRLCRERGVEIRMITSPSGYRSRFVGESELMIFAEASHIYGTLIREALARFGAASEIIRPGASGSVSARRKDVLREGFQGRVRIVRGNYSGTVASVDGAKIREALDRGIVPILPPLGHDRESGLEINIDGDRLAAAVAAEMCAEVLIVLSNVPGLMRDLSSPDSRVGRASLSEWEEVERYAQGNMKRKLVASKEALEGGVPEVYLADGRAKRPIGNAMGGDATCLAR